MAREVQISLGERSYPIAVGAGVLARLPAALRGLRGMVVTDAHVAACHGARVMELLGAGWGQIVVPPGEATKSAAAWADLLERLAAANLDRRSVLVALGGGVVGDLTGFAAAAYMRGIRFVQIPTSLLAMVDSSVGGKTGINLKAGKNLVGAFHQPRAVFIATGLLGTLPPREFAAGMAEVIKYGLLGDFAFFEWLETNGPAVLAGDPDALAYAVARSVEMKAEIVEADEKEAGRRALLNLGHTFGHALEAETGYGEALLHGEAVAAGSAIAFRFSAAQGLCSAQDAQRAETAIAAAGLPTRLDQVGSGAFDARKLVRHMAQDKKAEGGRLTFILARALGDAFVAKNVDGEAVRQFLVAEGAHP